MKEKQDCNNCDYLRSKLKFKDVRYFCRFKGNLSDLDGCKDWEERGEDYSEDSVYKDYKGRYDHGVNQVLYANGDDVFKLDKYYIKDICIHCGKVVKR